MGLGWTEIIMILVVLLFLFGPSRLPGMGKSIGEAIRGFKKGLESIDDEVKPPETRIVHSNQEKLSPGIQGETAVKDYTKSDNKDGIKEVKREDS